MDIEHILTRLEAEGSLRHLRVTGRDGKYIEVGGQRYLDMSSNDYLGLAADTAMQREFLESILDRERFMMGNPASRLMTGNSPDYEELEAALSGLFAGKATLVLGSGYAVNTALLPALTSPEDTVLADKYVHASIIDGLKLCGCRWQRYAHNDMGHLETLLKKSGGTGQVWVATESVFSMDGDRAPLHDIAALKERYGFKLYLDEAHAFGVFGENGEGLAHEYGLSPQADIIIGTFGKAAASAGGFVAVDARTRELLVNRMRSLIFSTALPPITLQWTKYVIDRFPDFDVRRRHLKDLVQDIAGDREATQIIPLMAYGNREALAMSERFREAGFWVTPVRYPTVPKGKERIRISLTAAMTGSDIEKFKRACSTILT